MSARESEQLLYWCVGDNERFCDWNWYVAEMVQILQMTGNGPAAEEYQESHAISCKRLDSRLKQILKFISNE